MTSLTIFRRGRLTKFKKIQLDQNIAIRDLDQDERYKYLGTDESDGIQYTRMKQAITKEYYHEICQVLKSELNSQNKITAINNLAVPVPIYSFGIND